MLLCAAAVPSLPEASSQVRRRGRDVTEQTAPLFRGAPVHSRGNGVKLRHLPRDRSWNQQWEGPAEAARPEQGRRGKSVPGHMHIDR